ncbi:hypothetical protein [Pseudalgibacter alginicilyticus]|nr:hypothetical protein [Pseudalgibacter alginicilyticus]
MPILIAGLVIEILLRNIPNDYIKKANRLAEYSKDIETLIIGNSHCLYGINPDYLDSNGYNLSNVSQSLDIDYEILKKHGSDLINLKTVVLNLSYFSLFEQLKKTNEHWRLKDYNIYFGLQLDFKPIHQSELLSVAFKTNLKRIYEYYIQDKNMINTSNLGWGTNAKSSNNMKDLHSIGIAVAKKHTINGQELYEENVDYLKRIITYCHNRNIKVLLVTTPVYKSYFSNLDKKQLNTTIAVGEQMESNYINCYYYNLLNSFKFTDDDFFDSDHLNEKGAEKLTFFLNEEILTLDENFR